MTAQPTLPFQPHSATSRDAARSMRPAAVNLREAVFVFIAGRRYMGATAQEIAAGCEMSGDTVRPRLVELARDGRIVRNGQTRQTASKRAADVWVAAYYAQRPEAEEGD